MKGISDMNTKRFIIEGEWIGNSQNKIVHRKVYPGNRKKFRAWANNVGAIQYTDGTFLVLSVRDCKPRERVTEILGYSSLIEDCFHYSVDRVSALPNARAAIAKATT